MKYLFNKLRRTKLQSSACAAFDSQLETRDDLTIQSDSRFVRGFTIVEMVIVAIIFSMIAAVVLFNIRQYSNNVSLESLTQDVALAIRNVQVEAVSGRYVSGSPLDFTPSYGLYFDLSEDDTSFVHFADFNNNTIYDGDTDGCGVVPGNECLEVLTLQEGYTFDCIKATTLDVPPMTIGACHTDAAIDTYAITFTRPESYPTSNNSQLDGYVQYADTQIFIANPAGDRGEIHLWSTGQVEVSDGEVE